MKKLIAVTLGILTAIGGFVDIGDLVANAQSGARFGMRQAWVVVVGVVGICVFAEMAGRVAAVSGRPVFDLVRERLGPRIAMTNLVGSYLVTLLTLTAEIGGIALTIQLASGLPHVLWVPLAAFAVWIVLWRVKFQVMEQVFGVLGLALVVFVVALIALDPPWGTFAEQLTHAGPPQGENWGTWGYLAVSLFASALTPYEVFFFSSGGGRRSGRRRTWRPSAATPSSASPSAGCSDWRSWAAPRRCSSPPASRSTSSARPRCRSRWRWGSWAWSW
ncbi:natural resistance-associated macrophage protein [Amycolatopsis methanolica 239]|uniref:Natural resistance-associated macrophage protein n=1 Tax=Amycolatopsis methanolica 239 TaxID=1068978 RepID=A0A076MU89_AMYME|nr:natural resistance-associated macrophage protein [Amycolatopsis methanolica 239]